MRYFILLLLVLTFFTCSTQLKNKKDCSHFRTGTFKYNKKGYESYNIVRNDSIQIETNSNNNIKIITSVEWISNCEYILTYKDIINFPYKDSLLGKKIYVEILQTKNDTYKCHVTSSTVDEEIEFIKIRK